MLFFQHAVRAVFKRLSMHNYYPCSRSVFVRVPVFTGPVLKRRVILAREHGP